MEIPKNVNFIKRDICKIGYITLSSLCNMPYGSFSGENSVTFHAGGTGCLLLLEFMTKADFKNRSFMISLQAKEEFLTSLKEVINWFLDQKYQDLFFETEDGLLNVNMRYKDLIKIIKEVRKDYRTLYIAPALVIDSLGHRQEGVAMRINTVDSEIRVTYRNLVRLYNVIVDIDYGMEYQTLLTVYNQCIETGRIRGDPRKLNQFVNDGNLIRRRPVNEPFESK